MEAAILADDRISDDAVLGGRVKVRQPRDGYRVAIDPVLLAAAVPARRGQAIIDAGAGVGTAGLCLAERVEGLSITAIEKNATLAALAVENAERNAVAMKIIEGDITASSEELSFGTFDHVMMNPPYLPAAHGHPSPSDLKNVATHEDGADIVDWIGFADEALKHKGNLLMIHRADRLDAILSALAGGFGEICIYPLWPKLTEGNALQEAKRIIIRARKGVASPTRLLSGLILHQADGTYTPQTDKILRGEASIAFESR